MSDAATTVDEVRRERLTRQGLRGGGEGRSLPEALAALVGVPMPVGVSAAVSLFARGIIARGAELDAAWLHRGELSAVPGPRGMLWLCAAADAPLLRSFAVADHAAREARVASACALTARDLSAARDALRGALATPRRAEELRAALPAAMVRSLGVPGIRAGASTLAGLVLRGMWCVGEVVRVPTNGRVDGEQFAFAVEAHPRVTPNAADAVDLVAARWFSAHAPARARDFAAAFGIAAGRAAGALKRLRLQSLSLDDETLLTPGDVTPAPWHDAEVSLLALRDPLTDASPGLALFADPLVAKSVTLKHLGAGPVVLVNGVIAGAWAVSPEGRVQLQLRGPRVASADEALERARALTERFVVEGFGANPSLHGAVLPRSLPPLTAEVGL